MYLGENDRVSCIGDHNDDDEDVRSKLYFYIIQFTRTMLMVFAVIQIFNSNPLLIINTLCFQNNPSRHL